MGPFGVDSRALLSLLLLGTIAASSGCIGDAPVDIPCKFTTHHKYGLSIGTSFKGAFRSYELRTGNGESGTLLLKEGLVPKGDSLRDWKDIQPIGIAALEDGKLKEVTQTFSKARLRRLESSSATDEQEKDCIVVQELEIAVGAEALKSQNPDAPPPGPSEGAEGTGSR